MNIFLLWCQVDPLAGGAGWAGAGLLGLVLSWLLLRHLPEKDRQAKEINDKNDLKITAIISSFRDEMRENREEFKIALQAMLLHCEKEVAFYRDKPGRGG